MYLSKSFNRKLVTNIYGKTSAYGFATASAELMDQLKKIGIHNKNVVWNPTYNIFMNNS